MTTELESMSDPAKKEITMDLQWQPLEDMNPALADLYRRAYVAIASWEASDVEKPTDEPTIAEVQSTLLSVLAEALVDSVSHLTPAHEDARQLWAEGVAEQLYHTILGRLLQERESGEHGVYLPARNDSPC